MEQSFVQRIARIHLIWDNSTACPRVNLELRTPFGLIRIQESDGAMNTIGEQPASKGTNVGRRYLWVSALLAGSIILLQAFGNQLHAWIRLDPGVVNIGTVVGTLVLLVLWASWLFRFGPGGIWMRLALSLGLLLLPLVGYLLTRPVLNGDVGIARFDGPIWLADERLADSNLGNRTQPESGNPNGARPPVDLSVTSPADYPQFLGPRRNAVVSEVQLDPDWSAKPPRQIWRVPVGQGWSGTAIVNGSVVTMEQLGNEECVSCFSLRDGALLWRHRYEQRHEDLAGMGKPGPRGTPTIDGGRVYAQGAAGKLVCLEGRDGSLVWEQDICELLEIPRTARKTLDGFSYLVEGSPLAWGRAGSPLVVGDLLYIPGGGPTGGPFHTLVALDKATGSMKWKAGDEMIAYGSPSLATLAGQEQILLVAERTAFGFEPLTGRVLWTHRRPGSSNAAANCSQVTVVDERRILLTKGYGLGGELVELSPGSELALDSIWKSSRVLTTKFSNPVIHAGHVFALADGFLECVELESGKLKWSLRDKFGHGQLLLVGDHLVVHSEFGNLGIFPASPDKPAWDIKIRTIKGLCWNTLALSGNKLIVRSDLEMACLELPIRSTNEVQK
jgi:outer membrane protein assembly factor BamB